MIQFPLIPSDDSDNFFIPPSSDWFVENQLMLAKLNDVSM